MTGFPSAQIIQIVSHADPATAQRLASEAGTASGLTQHLRITHDSSGGGIFLWSNETALNTFEQATGMSQLVESGSLQSRVFDILQPTTSITFDTSGKDLTEATRVQLVNMHLRLPMETFLASVTGPEAEATGKLFGAIPGIIGKVFLHSRQVDDIIGGCYLFSDDQTRCDYLSSELFTAVRSDENWENLTTEDFSIASS